MEKHLGIMMIVVITAVNTELVDSFVVIMICSTAIVGSTILVNSAIVVDSTITEIVDDEFSGES